MKLVFCHCEGIFEFFQNHKWEMAEKWRVKTSQKHLAPILILPADKNTIYLDFFIGTGDKPSLIKALKSLQRQGDPGTFFLRDWIWTALPYSWTQEKIFWREAHWAAGRLLLYVI